MTRSGESSHSHRLRCVIVFGLVIEGRGVEPDVVVDNLPHATFNGEDAQLSAAVKLLKKKLKDKPIPLPAMPPFPK